MFANIRSINEGQEDLERLLRETPEKVAQHKVGNLLDRKQIRTDHPEVHSDLVEWYGEMKSAIGSEDYWGSREVPDVDYFQQEANHIANMFNSAQELFELAGEGVYHPNQVNVFDDYMEDILENNVEESYPMPSPVRLAACEILNNSRKRGNEIYIDEDPQLPQFVDENSKRFLLYDNGQGIDNSEIADKMVYDGNSDQGIGLPMINYIDQNTRADIRHPPDTSSLALDKIEEGNEGCVWYIESPEL